MSGIGRLEMYFLTLRSYMV